MSNTYQIINNVSTDWKEWINNQINQKYFKNIVNSINKCNNVNIFPAQEDLFKAFDFFNIKDTKVVILGQDPYIHQGEAHGLSFSVKNQKITKSLINIFKELEDDLKIRRTNTNLTDWAKQGILLLNTILTVNENNSLSHKDFGWEEFSKNVIKEINDSCNDVVFVLWGNKARAVIPLITNKTHLIIKSTHPSPLSAHCGFFGSKPFSKINSFLMNKKHYNITW